MKHCKIILLVGLPACSASALAKKIGVSTAYFDQNFLTIIRQFIEKEVQTRHVDIRSEDARGDIGRQADQVQSFIASDVDTIVADPVDSAGTPQLTKIAQQTKMPLVYVNRTPRDKTLPPGVVFVDSDERESGTLQMGALAELANYGGDVAIMIGNLIDVDMPQRTKGVEQVVAKYPAMKMVQRQLANYSRSEGVDLVQNWAGGEEVVDIVTASNDEMAIDAATVLEKSQRKLLIDGIGAMPDGLKVLANDEIQVTVSQGATGQGRMALVVAPELIKGEKVESRVWIPFELVTKENMRTHVEKSH